MRGGKAGSVGGRYGIQREREKKKIADGTWRYCSDAISSSVWVEDSTFRAQAGLGANQSIGYLSIN